MVLPYRAKNPPEHFPYVTIGLIVINALIYVLTTESLLSIQRPVVNGYAVSHNTLSFWRLLTAMFLHANILHIVGNMLFLWIFGASLEGRLRPLKYLMLYLVAGLAGGILHEVVSGIAKPEQFSLGASGAIMGVAGAYLFTFPYSTICVFVWLGYFMRASWDVQARWIVLFYVGMDLLEAIAFKGGDGVGHLAHLGGAGMGFLLVFLLRTKRDSADVSEVQAVHAEMKDYSLLKAFELEKLLQRGTDDMNLVMAYCERAALEQQGAQIASSFETLNKYSLPLMEKADPNRLASVLLRIPPAIGAMPLVYYLRLASRLESIASNDLAAQLYRRVYDLAPNAPDTETALFRLAQLMEKTFHNRPYAMAIYNELLRLFPEGQMALQARRALQQS